jgi:divalent metal cation (Fe/Co/Zn/Cd) transporter
VATKDTSTTPIYYALGANGGIAAAKFAAAVFTGSGAMLERICSDLRH